MKFNFNEPLLGLDLKPVMQEGKEANLGKMLGNHINGMTGEGDSIKIRGWGIKMWSGEDIELDESDLEVLRGLIKKLPMATHLIRGQALVLLNRKPAPEIGG
jgi:hypothetical protein